jgi:hypothetical protein
MFDLFIISAVKMDKSNNLIENVIGGIVFG